MPMSEKRQQCRTETGVVERGPKSKTIVVKTTRLTQHPKYRRYVRRATIYRVHDETEQARPGDTVEIAETRPISKTKNWRLVRIVSRGTQTGSEVQS